MILRKVTANTTNEARQEAERLYGKTFIILETREASAASPASLTIGLDAAAAQPQPVRKSNADAAPASVTSLFKPFMEQFNRLVETGTETLKSIKTEGVAAQEKTTSGPAPQTNAPEGVTYIKSRPEVKDTQPEPPAPDPAAKETDFHEHFRKKPEPSSIAGKQISSLNQRFEFLEDLVLQLAEGDQTPFSGNPFYRFLRKIQFRPDTLIPWFSGSSEQKLSPNPAIPDYVLSRLDDYFFPAAISPPEEEPFHLFSSFYGTRIIDLIRSVNRYYLKKGIKTDTGILFSNTYESDETGLQIADALKSSHIVTRSIVTWQDWNRMLEERDPDSRLLLAAVPVNGSAENVTAHWSHMNRVLGEHHSVKHHFVAHALHNPLDVIARLPLDHPFRPDYVSLTNLDICSESLGRLSAYRNLMDSPFGFLHKGESEDSISGELIEGDISGMLLSLFENELKTPQSKTG